MREQRKRNKRMSRDEIYLKLDDFNNRFNHFNHFEHFKTYFRIPSRIPIFSTDKNAQVRSELRK